MKDRSFHAMVVIEPRIGRYRYVRSAADAGKVLLREWPGHRGANHQKALEAVLEVLKGNAQPSVARDPFIAAAEESGILVDAQPPHYPRFDHAGSRSIPLKHQ
ncbi:DUF982 domain-containing protein [Mesorhizobium sp.]|nr:DUF982 domain-containing protein [Mesorhizobium sp.]